uniref:Uncharacterized protein n=1 Tax=Glossina pallidipes TaxID=7398 RepID=A0A1A9ZXY5_GLOPL
MALCGGGGGLPSSVRYELRAAKFEHAYSLLYYWLSRDDVFLMRSQPKDDHSYRALVKSLTSSVEVVCMHTKAKTLYVYYNESSVLVDPIYVDRPYAQDPLSTGTNNDISPLNDRDISSSRAPAVVILSRKRCKCCICSLASAELLGVTQEACVVSAEATRELRSSKTFWN